MFKTMFFISSRQEVLYAFSLAITISIKVIASLIRQPIVCISHDMLDLLNLASIFWLLSTHFSSLLLTNFLKDSSTNHVTSCIPPRENSSLHKP